MKSTWSHLLIKLSIWEGEGWLALDSFAVEVLMKLQYEFPLVEEPYAVIADALGTSVNHVFEKTVQLVKMRVIRRIGFYLNYRSLRQQAALIAFRVNEPARLHEWLSSRIKVTHSYLREHPIYNLWVVVRGDNKDSIRRLAEEAAKLNGVEDYVVLWGVRTYRLSVKLDLKRGISRAGPFSTINPNPPRPEDLGYSADLARSFQSLPLSKRPFREIGYRFGMSEDEVLDAAKDMLRHGILGDPGATLNTEVVGFNYNAMFVLRPSDDVSASKACQWVVDNIVEATHIVEREPEPKGKFDYSCYFMVHARRAEFVNHIHNLIRSSGIISDYSVLRSIGRIGELEVRA